ncbi:MAG: glutamate racemase [Thermomicrobiales bacterium]|nr:glutamate racemase [Thermomicrobiales bacterium]
MSCTDHPIGVFDSGFGGLSVLRALRAQMPQESFIYLADSAFCPYGDKDDATIESRVHLLMGELVARDCKAMVVACNTACSVAIGSLRERLGAPIVGLEPAVKPAARRTRTRKVAVLATPRTARGQRLHQLVETHAPDIEVETIPAPGLVDLIESGQSQSREIRYLLSNLLEGPLARGCDVVVLGCTHYPFLAGAIAEIVGPSVAIVSSGNAVARQTERVLRRSGLLSASELGGRCDYLTTGDPLRFDAVACELLGTVVRSESIGAQTSVAV